MKWRTDRKLYLRDVTLRDIARVMMRYGIRVRFNVRPAWIGPWRLDRPNRVWWRQYGTDLSGTHTVERSLDAD